MYVRKWCTRKKALEETATLQSIEAPSEEKQTFKLTVPVYTRNIFNKFQNSALEGNCVIVLEISAEKLIVYARGRISNSNTAPLSRISVSASRTFIWNVKNIKRIHLTFI
jgi:hypothetical protein